MVCPLNLALDPSLWLGPLSNISFLTTAHLFITFGLELLLALFQNQLSELELIPLILFRRLGCTPGEVTQLHTDCTQQEEHLLTCIDVFQKVIKSFIIKVCLLGHEFLLYKIPSLTHCGPPWSLTTSPLFHWVSDTRLSFVIVASLVNFLRTVLSIILCFLILFFFLLAYRFPCTWREFHSSFPCTWKFKKPEINLVVSRSLLSASVVPLPSVRYQFCQCCLYADTV